MSKKVDKSIRICRLDPAGAVDFPTIENNAVAIHKAVGGYFEMVQLPHRLAGRGLVGLCDEDGLRRELPYNVYSPLLGRQYVGPFLILRSRVPEFASLTDDDEAAIRKWFDAIIVTVESSS